MHCTHGGKQRPDCVHGVVCGGNADAAGAHGNGDKVAPRAVWTDEIHGKGLDRAVCCGREVKCKRTRKRLHRAHKHIPKSTSATSEWVGGCEGVCVSECACECACK